MARLLVAIASLISLLVFALDTPHAQAATFVVDTASDASLTQCGPAAADCSLRGAITEANANPGLDFVDFAIGSGPQTITVGAVAASPLPPITEPVVVSGLTQPGCLSACITLSAAGGLPSTADGLYLDSGSSGSTIHRLVIQDFPDNGIEVSTSSNTNTVTGNIIGTDGAGAVGLGNGRHGVLVWSWSNTIGGAGSARNVISGNTQDGVSVQGGAASGNILSGNYIGTDPGGTLDVGNSRHGIFLQSAPSNQVVNNLVLGNTFIGISLTASAGSNAIRGNQVRLNGTHGISVSGGTGNIIGGTSGITVGGPCSGDCNLVQQNGGAGIVLTSGAGTTSVAGNFIGTDGSADNGNTSHGIAMTGASTSCVGGLIAGFACNSMPASRNYISGNNGNGVLISAGSGNRVQGNYIGTNAAGTLAIPNSLAGVRIDLSSGNTIGGASATTTPCGGSCNLVSGNGQDGVLINAGGNNEVHGNHLGANQAGTGNLGNGASGIQLINTTNNNVGNLAGNLVRSNTQNGVEILASGAGNVLAGNRIVNNAVYGVYLTSSGNRIGGTSGTTPGGPCTGNCNLITGSTLTGIYMNGTLGNMVAGNYIGTDGTADLGNASEGIALLNTTDACIGGDMTTGCSPSPAARNVISGNNGNGVWISGGSGNRVFASYLGANAVGNGAIPNGGSGVAVLGGTGHAIGGDGTNAGNLIAGNMQDGVAVTGATSAARVRGNAIDGNGDLGIDLNSDGVTANDPQDSDVGPNGLQNHPVLSLAGSSGTSTTVEGTLDSAPDTTYLLDFYASPACDTPGSGEGAAYLGGGYSLTTDALGYAPFAVIGLDPVTPGHVVTATATELLPGRTSELSPCIATVPGSDSDSDFVFDPDDNCVVVPNTNQLDTDGEGIGDACDNCPATANSGQENLVHPVTPPGDHCEDPESDGVVDLTDNCPDHANAGQENTVHPLTALGDHCEDPEPDGVFDAADNCPDAINPVQENAVHPLTPAGDQCEDHDADLVLDALDNCPDTANPAQENAVHPGSFAGDHCEDPEPDGAFDVADNCPDHANPGQENLVHPLSPLGDHCEDPEPDGVFDVADNCPDHPNAGQENAVHPLSPLGDHCEDPEPDGVFDATDNCPDTPNPGQQNAVHPGTPLGDHCEDPDADLVMDAADNCPDTPNPGQQNIVHGGTFAGDLCEDPDADAVFDSTDNCPNIPNPVQDNLDGDPYGDACEISQCVAVPTAWTNPPGDDDCDGFTTAIEGFVGTVSTVRCPATGAVNDEPLPDVWPPDFDDNRLVNTIDIGKFVPALNSVAPGPPYSPRLDLTGDGRVTTTDVGKMVAFLSKTCT